MTFNYNIRLERLSKEEFQDFCSYLALFLEGKTDTNKDIERLSVYAKAQSATDRLIDKTPDLIYTNCLFSFMKEFFTTESLCSFLEYCEEKVHNGSKTEQEYIEDADCSKYYIERYGWILKMTENEQVFDVYAHGDEFLFSIIPKDIYSSFLEILKNGKEHLRLLVPVSRA